MSDEEGSAPLRERAAAALRRLGHAVVAHQVDDDLLARIAALADTTAANVEQQPPRERHIDVIKRRLWERPPADGEPMSHFSECVVSGPANPLGIAIRVRRDGDEAVADVNLGPAFEGAPSRAHGGVTAAVFDDVMGYVLVLLRVPAYTGRLTVRYLAPVPLGVDLVVRARLVDRDGRKLTMAAQLCDGEQVLCEAEGLFIAIPSDRFAVSARAVGTQ